MSCAEAGHVMKIVRRTPGGFFCAGACGGLFIGGCCCCLFRPVVVVVCFGRWLLLLLLTMPLHSTEGAPNPHKGRALGRAETPRRSGEGTRAARRSNGGFTPPATPEGGRWSEAHTHRGRAITRSSPRAQGLVNTPSGDVIGAARGCAGRRTPPTEHRRRGAKSPARDGLSGR